MADAPPAPGGGPAGSHEIVRVLSNNHTFWVVNTSPPGNGPGGAAYTRYTIVEGTQNQAENIPGMPSGGISGPYHDLQAAYNVWKNEPQNTNTSTLQQIEYLIGAGISDLGNPTNPAASVGAGKEAQQLASGPFAGLGGVIGAIDTFFHALTDAAMWRSLAWIIGGAILLVVGVFLWLKHEGAFKNLPVPIPV